MVSTGSRISVTSVGQDGYNPANEKTWAGRPFWTLEGDDRDLGPIYSSHVFDVYDCPLVVRAFGLQKNSRIIVQMVAGCNSGSYFEDWYFKGTRQELHMHHNMLILPVDGRYRLRMCGLKEHDLANFVVTQHRTGTVFDFANLI